MARRPSEVSKVRREEVIEAASAIIAEEGIQNLSLSAIEERAGMSRGQLTYYFPTKEDILLAVFDRLLQMLHERVQGVQENGSPCAAAGGTGWERLGHFLTFFLTTPPDARVFHALQYTFLSQIGHREDFRARLAGLYGQWRGHMAQDMEADLARRQEAHPQARPVSARTFATFVQALLHGLAMQRTADPDAYDRHEMLALTLDVLGSYLGTPCNVPGPGPNSNGQDPSPGPRTPPVPLASPSEETHEPDRRSEAPRVG